MANVTFTSISFDCLHFEKEGTQHTVRVVTSPIRIIHDIDPEGRDEEIVMMGCNMYQKCDCVNCVYSGYSRDQARERKKQALLRNGVSEKLADEYHRFKTA